MGKKITSAQASTGLSVLGGAFSGAGAALGPGSGGKSYAAPPAAPAIDPVPIILGVVALAATLAAYRMFR